MYYVSNSNRSKCGIWQAWAGIAMFLSRFELKQTQIWYVAGVCWECLVSDTFWLKARENLVCEQDISIPLENDVRSMKQAMEE